MKYRKNAITKNGEHGCDNCGNSEGFRAGKKFPMNKQFLNVYLCSKCLNIKL